MKRFALFFLLLTACAAFAPNQILRTSLRITVLDELGNPAEGAVVRLYATEEDYHASSNAVGEKAITNKKGIAKIGDLEPRTYFIDVRQGDKNNIGGGVQTDTLKEGRINKINIIIE